MPGNGPQNPRIKAPHKRPGRKNWRIPEGEGKAVWSSLLVGNVQFAVLKHLAHEEGVSLFEYVRRVLRKHLESLGIDLNKE